MQIEDEQHFFFQQQQDQFFPQQLSPPSNPYSLQQLPIQPFDYVSHFKNVEQKAEQAQLFQDWGFITQQQKKNFQKFSEHNKYMTGIQGMITLQGKEKNPNIMMNQEFELGSLFGEDQIQARGVYQKNVLELIKVINTVDHNIVENFDNFNYIQKANGYQFLQNISNYYHESMIILKTKKDKVELFSDIFCWWLQGFRNMILEIEKCSPLYTLNVFKKEKQKEKHEPVMMMVELQSKAEDEESKQRKLWSRYEIEMLNKIMDTNTNISSSKIKEVANELGRSVVAVQSKIQKLQKEKRDKPINDLSLEKKMLIVLASYSYGLGKQELLVKMHEQFEMGDEQTWKKSVSQLLSISKKVTKSKGIFTFTSSPILQPPTNFKNKVVACLMQLPNCRGNLKSIIRKYLQKFSFFDGINNDDGERIKSIEASIYKTIFKYDIFDKSNSKIVYRYVENEGNRDSQSDRSESGSKDFGL